MSKETPEGENQKPFTINGLPKILSEVNQLLKPSQFDISKHKFSDKKLTVKEVDGLIMFQEVRGAYASKPHFFNKDDVIAMAKHFNIVDEMAVFGMIARHEKSLGAIPDEESAQAKWAREGCRYMSNFLNRGVYEVLGVPADPQGKTITFDPKTMHKAGDMVFYNDTDHLSSSENNKARLKESIKQFEDGEVVAVEAKDHKWVSVNDKES